MKKSLKAFIETFGVSIVLYILFMLFVAQSIVISGSSMLPTLETDEKLIAEKVTYKTRDPQRGEIVVFRDHRNQRVFLIKRIIAVPGDVLIVDGNSLVLNNQLMKEPYILNTNNFDQIDALKPYLGFPLPEDKYIVLGDNRLESFDSRYFGPIDKKDIVGKAFLIFWPLDKARVL